MHESCGIFGVYAPGEDVARLTFFALFALQHRGQESAGIATTDGKKLQVYTRMGLVSQVFNEDSLAQLGGNTAIGHNRYSTAGSSRVINSQPIVVGRDSDAFAIAQKLEKEVVSTLGVKKKIFPNVDFYSGLVYSCLGIPPEMFTPIFAVSRVSGWTSRVMEYLENNRIFRPRAMYTGPFNKKYKPLDKR